MFVKSQRYKAMYSVPLLLIFTLLTFHAARISGNMSVQEGHDQMWMLPPEMFVNRQLLAFIVVSYYLL
jgi:hypothetical protein